MKTPEEIKRGLECCEPNKSNCYDCPYYAECHLAFGGTATQDALAYIQQLEREKMELLDLCEQFGQCTICKYTNRALCQSPCCDCWYGGGDERSYWEWRGVEEDE